MDALALLVNSLSKRYRVHTTAPAAGGRIDALRSRIFGRREDIWALRDVTFDVERGEILGVLGTNGSGKTTLLTVLAGITSPTSGYARIGGRVSPLLGLGTGFHPQLTGRENVFLNAVLLGMSKREVERKFDEIVEFSEIEEFIDLPVKRYSSGMQARLAFSIAAHVEPEVMLVDEILGVGDHRFREKCDARMAALARQGVTGVIVSHQGTAFKKLCRRVLVLQQGRIAFFGAAEEGMDLYFGDGLGDRVRPTRRKPVKGHLSAVRIADVQVRNADGGDELFPDEPVRIHVQLEADEPVAGRFLLVTLLITDETSRPISLITNRLDPDEPLRRMDGVTKTTLVCELDRLALRPNGYLLTAQLYRGGEVVHAVRDIPFQISPSDFFGSGRLPTGWGPPLLLRSRWALEESPPSLSIVSGSTMADGD